MKYYNKKLPLENDIKMVS